MIEFRCVSKHYGPTTAVDKLSVEVRPGHVTGLLGPNGAGKSTALRLALGLDRPSSETALIGGVPYASIREPLRVEEDLLRPFPCAVPARHSDAGRGDRDLAGERLRVRDDPRRERAG